VTEPGRQWILFELNGQSFAILAEHIREMTVLEAVHRSPIAPAHVRGTMLLRGHCISTVDLRVLLGMRSYREDHRTLVADFAQRKQDHINWLTELESSVRENRPFKLTLDPHRCAFGRWYDQYRPDDAVLSLKLLQFDRPHQIIHALGASVRGLVEQGRQPEALAMIEDARAKDLSSLLKLFDETSPMIASLARELVVIVSNGTRQMGLIVDDVNDMREFDSLQIQEFPADSPLRSAGDWVHGLGVNGDRVAVFLDCARILDRLAI
jgi:chemotaxis signal transduction protein